MKSILVIETPESCEECPLKRYSNLQLVCTPMNRDVEDVECPLRPLPYRLDANDWHRVFSGLFSEREAKGYGWNACLDEILGGNEDASEDV